MSGTTFSATGRIVTYTVPATGLYDITAIGASGGNTGFMNTDAGGFGAEVSGDVQLTAGEVLFIAVGGEGASADGSGGGGGSFVTTAGNVPVVIAGGGGGAATGSLTGDGGNGGGIVTSGGGGGTGGGTGGGGGGLLGNGETGASLEGGQNGPGGSSFANGGAGGTYYDNPPMGAGNGGFGGGGAGAVNSDDEEGGGGGGGGYTGGNGGNVPQGPSSEEFGGSGGTSFDSGINQHYSVATADGDGSVTLTLLVSAPVISGTQANQATTDQVAIDPFSKVTITDANSGNPSETVTVVPTNSVNGVLSDPNAATDGGTVTNGIYVVRGSAAAVTKAIDGLVFTPTTGQVAPGQTVTTQFVITDSSSLGQTAVDANTKVAATAAGGGPLTLTVAEGQTENLYQAVSGSVQDTSPNAQITITSLGLTDTVGAAYLNSASALLTYTADGYQPSATQPQDSFNYTAEDQFGHIMTGTVGVVVSGSAAGSTQVGGSGDDRLVANASGQTLIGGNGDDRLTGNGCGQSLFGGNGNDTLTANGSDSKIYGGTGTNKIRLNGEDETVVLQQGGTDRITGFSLANGDQLDLSQVLAEVGKTRVSIDDFQVVSHGNNATLFYTGATSFTGGAALAQLIGVGPDFSLQTLLDADALKTS